MALGRPLGAKLFLEGMEVPFIGATITCTVNQASIAYIDLVPHSTINNIKPRTLVQIFVRDYLDPGPECVYPYVLAWQGEVFGYSFGKTPTSRTFSISCIDYSGQWDCAMAYYFNAQQSLGSASADRASQAATATDVSKMKQRVITNTVSEQSFFIQKIKEVLSKNNKSNPSDPKNKDFLDGFVAIYDHIGNVNDFFKSANERLRVSDQIVIHSSKKLLELLEEGAALNWFLGIPGKSSGYSTLRTVIGDLMSLIFHDMVPVPFPSAVKRSAEFTSGGSKAHLRGSKDRLTIGSFAFKPNLYMLPPPSCNIFFPDEYSNFQFSRNFFKEPTRLIYMPELPARFGQGAAAVYMPHVYMPPSFENYMLGKGSGWEKYQGTDGTSIPKNSDPGKWGDEHTKKSEESFKALDNNKKREYFFLTNEEHMKGIWMARETMMPATSQFRTALSESSDTGEVGTRANFSKRVANYLFYKKRFQDRSLQITSHLKLSVVPGFPVLILDDSSADQSMLAYCSSVTHRIYATEGGYTNTTLSYARQVVEQDIASSNGTQMPIPPWFDKAIFGEVNFPPESTAAKKEVSALGLQYVAPEGQKLSSFFESLLGKKGTRALTERNSKEKTVVGSVRDLLNEYHSKKKSGAADVQRFIAHVTARDYIRMSDCFRFIGAKSQGENATTTAQEQTKISIVKKKDTNNTGKQERDLDSATWIRFDSDEFKRKGKPDELPIKYRREIITGYRNALKTNRGFSG